MHHLVLSNDTIPVTISGVISKGNQQISDCAATHCSSVIIVAMICLTVLIIGCYAIRKYFDAKDEERKASKSANELKKTSDQAEAKAKQIAALEGKLVDFMYDLTKKQGTKPEELIKAEQDYIDQLQQLINKKEGNGK